MNDDERARLDGKNQGRHRLAVLGVFEDGKEKAAYVRPIESYLLGRSGVQIPQPHAVVAR